MSNVEQDSGIVQVGGFMGRSRDEPYCLCVLVTGQVANGFELTHADHTSPSPLPRQQLAEKSGQPVLDVLTTLHNVSGDFDECLAVLQGRKGKAQGLVHPPKTQPTLTCASTVLSDRVGSNLVPSR